MAFKVCHLTSVHPRYDTRIYVKECQSLNNAGYDTHLVVADGNGDEHGDVVIHDAGKSSGRINRIIKTVHQVYKKAIEIDADLYHLHDPELIFVGLVLKAKGKVVVFDAHEDFPKQLKNKPYLNRSTAKVLAYIASFVERIFLSKFDAVVAATPFIRAKFSKLGFQSVDVNNYPTLHEFSDLPTVGAKSASICYVGGITKARGVLEDVDAVAVAKPEVTLELAGTFTEAAYQKEVESRPGWKKVNFHGWLGRKAILELLAKSKAGLVTLHPIENYLDSLPVKMFEYMASGIPVICSDIPLWKGIVEREQCGIAVDPFNNQEIVDAIEKLMADNVLASEMGRNGRRAVVEKYNWSNEEAKLIALYENLLR